MNLIPRHALLDSWFDKDLPAFRLLPETAKESSMLAVDIRENDKSYTLKADFPGLKKEEISVTVDNNLLTLRASHKETSEQKEAGRIIRQERRSGEYSRSFSLGEGIDEAAIDASFSDGVLSLEIPKAAPHQPKATSIPIK